MHPCAAWIHTHTAFDLCARKHTPDRRTDAAPNHGRAAIDRDRDVTHTHVQRGGGMTGNAVGCDRDVTRADRMDRMGMRLSSSVAMRRARGSASSASAIICHARANMPTHARTCCYVPAASVAGPSPNADWPRKLEVFAFCGPHRPGGSERQRGHGRARG